MYVIFLQCTHCVEKTLIVSCTLLCESGDRVKVDQSSFSAYLHAVMLRHHCSEYVSYDQGPGTLDLFFLLLGPRNINIDTKFQAYTP